MAIRWRTAAGSETQLLAQLGLSDQDRLQDQSRSPLRFDNTRNSSRPPRPGSGLIDHEHRALAVREFGARMACKRRYNCCRKAGRDQPNDSTTQGNSGPHAGWVLVISATLSAVVRSRK